MLYLPKHLTGHRAIEYKRAIELVTKSWYFLKNISPENLKISDISPEKQLSSFLTMYIF